jgi:predicted nucleotidyltransferase component of viral defense system
LKGKIAFRGGTAIHKLLFSKPFRYSEDIDLVQVQSEPIGATVDAIRDALSWLGKCSREQVGHSMHLVFKFTPEVSDGSQLKLKVELNTREHHHLYGIKSYPFEIKNSWYQATTEIASFEPEEIFGTKLRALLQRHKNRDLLDLNEGLVELEIAPSKVIECFEHYLGLEGVSISRATHARKAQSESHRGHRAAAAIGRDIHGRRSNHRLRKSLARIDRTHTGRSLEVLSSDDRAISKNEISGSAEVSRSAHGNTPPGRRVKRLCGSWWTHFHGEKDA